jgi:hypothetical protein
MADPLRIDHIDDTQAWIAQSLRRLATLLTLLPAGPAWHAAAGRLFS